tara:strand:+ start:386 stop:664 length:279 start_codon:yes stop_codon:yes gene_type:complete
MVKKRLDDYEIPLIFKSDYIKEDSGILKHPSNIEGFDTERDIFFHGFVFGKIGPIKSIHSKTQKNKLLKNKLLKNKGKKSKHSKKNKKRPNV